MSDNLYAGASIQVYPGGEETLSTPHSDVKAFLDYVGQFNSINFHAKDDDVQEWRYNHKYDNWQDRVGMDSVRVFYHNGHSEMSPNGRFAAAMGRKWDNTMKARSSRMSFGDQRLRYLLWSSCNSLQMHYGQNPRRTWAASNKGARMIFGFDSETYDLDGLGAGFFREWNTGKSFSQAWQDAALATTQDHRPSSTACGATAEEAQDRLWNERLFYGDAVSDNWYWWRWAGPVPIEIHLGISIPRSPLNLQLSRRTPDAATAASLADRFGVRPILARLASPEPGREGRGADVLDGPRLVLLPDGSYQVFLTDPDRSVRALDPESIKAAAEQAVCKMCLDVELAFDRLTATYHAGSNREGDQTKEAVADYTAHYRQLHDGIPATRGGDGHVSITLDPSGNVCTIVDRTVAVIGADEARPAGADTEIDVEAALAEAEIALRMRLCLDKSSDRKIVVVPDSTDVGYRFDRGCAVAVARRHVEVSGGGYTIRQVLEVVL